MKTQLALAAALALLIPGSALAQAPTARSGGVDGMEMSLEGALRAPRGATLRWLITAYEVRGLEQLSPAVGTSVHVATSLDRTEEAASVTTDAYGRAAVSIPIPADAPDRFDVVIRLVSAGGVQRRFDLGVSATAPERLALHVDRPMVRPGGPLRAFGRLATERTGRPLGERVVRLTLRDQQGRPLAAPPELRTDAAGLFAHTFTVPADAEGGLAVTARTDDEEHPVTANAQSFAGEARPEPLLVAIAPERWVLRPAERIGLDVVVRTPNGRPVPGAVITLPGAEREDRDRRARTDARGRARLAWQAPGYSTGIHDVGISVTATREGRGSARGDVAVRVAASPYAFGYAVEGGALAPSLGGRVFARVVDAYGRPAPAGVSVTASGPRLPSGGLSASTDADGIATFDVVLQTAADATSDRCGGETATALELRVGTGPQAASLAPCLPLDPDAAARVRVARPLLRLGQPVEVTLERAPAAARLPLELTVFRVGPEGPEAISQQVVAPGDRTATLTPDATGALLIAARPLFGPTRQVIRGGVAGIWVVPGDPARVRAELSANGDTLLRFEGASGERSALVVASPVDTARELARQLRAQNLGPLGDLRRDPGAATDALLSAALAARVRADVSAPFVLRGGAAVPVPAPTDAVGVGLLRDPWRARSRFVTGRLALIYRALEGYVSSALPERLEDVAVRGPRGYTFNGQILDSVAASGNLGAAGATGLGGEPLTIEALQRFDPSLTYDNVARRITRERLFRLILALRELVNSQGWDLEWSRLGDPSTWIRTLMHRGISTGGYVQQRDMVDGWGRPFELRQARGGRSRFGFVNSLGTWEIVSSGPDGRFGSGDDQWDPTARILRSATPYADAVGEDVLVARLSGVELGRATIELLQNVEPQARAGYVPSQSSVPAQHAAQAAWDSIPTPFDPPSDALALRRPARPGDGAGGAITRLPQAGGTVTLTLDEEPRTWGAVVYAWTDEGWGAVDVASTLAGAPVIVEAPVPHRLRTGEPVELDVVITNVTDAALPVRVEATGEGFELDAPASLTLPAGEASATVLGIRPGAQPGSGAIALRLVGDAGPVRAVRWSVDRVTGEHPLRVRAAGLVRGRPWRARFRVPEDARRGAGRVVVLAPSALAADPDLADLRRDDPALVAFSDALAGRTSDPTLWARLLRMQQPDGLVSGREPYLSSAAAAVAWAGAGEHDEDAQAALARLRNAISALGSFGGSDPSAEEVRLAAAVLAALSSGGVPELGSSARAGDPIAMAASGLRVALRRTLRAHPEEPTLLARAAGALLLADPRDAYGRAMLERAEAHLVEAPDGGARVVPSERMPDALESLAATLALAVAAHQVGRAELAERLARGGLGRDHVALRAGGESAFWLLAAGAYGALGSAPESVTVRVNGTSQVVSLAEGRGVVPLTVGAGDHEVVVEGPAEGSAFVRVEAAMERPFVDRAGGPLALRLEGEPGTAETVAALELTVTAREEVSAPVVEISLPAGVRADEDVRALIGGGEGILSVEARAPGFLRIRLAPMADGTERTIPLPLRWTVRGALRGLGAVAYPLGRPEDMSALAPRTLEVRPAE